MCHYHSTNKHDLSWTCRMILFSTIVPDHVSVLHCLLPPACSVAFLCARACAWMYLLLWT